MQIAESLMGLLYFYRETLLTKFERNLKTFYFNLAAPSGPLWFKENTLMTISVKLPELVPIWTKGPLLAFVKKF